MKDDTPSISQEIRAEGGGTISGVTQIIAEKYYSRSQAEELSEFLKHAVAAVPADKELYQRQIEATDRQIDALAYELYGLTEEEIGIVESLSH